MFFDNLEILGFEAEIDSIGKTLDQINKLKEDNEIIQLVNADSVAGKKHIVHGVNQAFLAFERGENLAKEISVEIVLRCSAQRQISKAFDLLGLKEGNINLCAILINCKDHSQELSSFFKRNDDVLIPNYDYLSELYNISDFEKENFSVEEIIVDRISKLTVDY